MDDELWMAQAIEQARRAGEDVPVGAIVVKNGAIIASACNQREAQNDPAGHAEIIAMRQAATALRTWRLTDTTIYCTLEPCPMCAEAMLQSRIARLVYGAYDPVSGAVGSVFDLFEKNRIYPKPQVTGGVLEETCKNMLVDFFKNRRKRDNEQEDSLK